MIPPAMVNAHALDCEWAVEPTPIPRLVSVAIAGPSGCHLLHHNDSATPSIVRDVLRGGVIGANIPSDLFAMARRWPDLIDDILAAYERDGVWDVLTLDKFLVYAAGDFEKKFGLAAVAKRRLGIELAKGDDTYRLRYGELLDTPIVAWPPEARRYALDDTTTTLAVWFAQWYARPFEDVFDPAPHIARKHFAIYRQSLIGMALDPVAVAALEARLDAEIRECTRVCIENGLARPKSKKPGAPIQRSKKAAAAMLEALEGAGVRRTEPTTSFPMGQVQLSEDALKAARIPDGHPLDAFRRLGSRQSQKTKFISPRRGPVVYTRFEELLITGRTGSSGYREGDWREDISDNLQNQPKETDDDGVPFFRVCHVPRPRYRYIISDVTGAELCTLAQVQLDWFGSSRLAEVLNADRNPHDELACTILGIPRESFDKRIGEHSRARQLAKVPNFGYPGGLGPKRFIDFAFKDPYNLVLTLDEAKALKAQWLETWPEMRSYFDYINSLEGPDGLITIKGPRFGIIRGGATYTEACNFPFQGLAAAALGSALWSTLRASLDRRSPLFGSYQVLHVHDEIVTEAPEDRVEEARAEQDRLIVEAFRHWCPDVRIKVDSKISTRYDKA